MKDSSERTVSYWAKNYTNTVAGTMQFLNFWDLPTAFVEQSKIAFPEVPASPYRLAPLRLLAEKVQPGTLENGLSIGCGSGHKELQVLKDGFVQHFTLVELVPELLEAARVSFEAAGLSDKVTLIRGDYREHLSAEKFDLIYFDNALHHMQSVDSVIEDMIGLLNRSGYFVMDDFVGPTYNQFEDDIFKYADHVRGLLPQSAFGEETPFHKNLGRVSIQDYINSDPSEACDSASILPAIAKYMPRAEIIPTGGLIYYLSAREIFGELTKTPDRDDAIIRLLFELDRVLVRANPETTCYALAIWQKPDGHTGKAEGADWKQLIRWPAWGIPIRT